MSQEVRKSLGSVGSKPQYTALRSRFQPINSPFTKDVPCFLIRFVPLKSRPTKTKKERGWRVPFSSWLSGAKRLFHLRGTAHPKEFEQHTKKQSQKGTSWWLSHPIQKKNARQIGSFPVKICKHISKHYLGKQWARLFKPKRLLVQDVCITCHLTIHIALRTRESTLLAK